MNIIQLFRGLISALRTLTVLPVPGTDAINMASALPWFPVVGGLLGGVLLCLFHLFQCTALAGWPEGMTFFLLFSSILLTRGLHLDGLADAADGFFSMTDRERTLAIMKDSRVGTFGVLAIVMILGLKWLAISRLVQHGCVYWMLPAAIGSRTLMAVLANTLPYARREGGCGAPFVDGAKTWHYIAVWLVAIICHLPLGLYMPMILIVTVVSALLLGWFYQKRVGGITGDLLGAASELCETILLALFAALCPQSPFINFLKAHSW